MEDVITILLIVLWVGFSLYNAARKRKKAQEKSAPSTSRPARKTIEQMLEDLINEKKQEVMPEEEEVIVMEDDNPYEREVKPLFETSTKAFTYEAESFIKPAKSMEVMESYESNFESFRLTSDKTHNRSEHSKSDQMDIGWLFDDEGGIDLKRAVVYYEILHRPYQ